MRLIVNLETSKVWDQFLQQKYQVTAVMLTMWCGYGYVDVNDKRSKGEDDGDKDPPVGTHFAHLNLKFNNRVNRFLSALITW